ncbi:MAG: hypothetical protein ABIQ64_02180 [Candidatus Saccharimonadales bacterium]
MFMAFFSWWYTDGWKRQLHAVSNRLAGVIDTFSVDILVRTLFSPFRQISAGSVRGPIGVQLRAFVDKLVSRFIGAIVRLAVLITGSITIVVGAMIGCMYLLVWPLLPVLPLVAILVVLGATM